MTPLIGNITCTLLFGGEGEWWKETIYGGKMNRGKAQILWMVIYDFNWKLTYFSTGVEEGLKMRAKGKPEMNKHIQLEINNRGESVQN